MLSFVPPLLADARNAVLTAELRRVPGTICAKRFALFTAPYGAPDNGIEQAKPA